jgi:hypothetical protein
VKRREKESVDVLGMEGKRKRRRRRRLQKVSETFWHDDDLIAVTKVTF